MIEELQLGALYAALVVLLLHAVLSVAFVVWAVAWVRAHARGAVAWNESTVETKLERK